VFLHGLRKVLFLSGYQELSPWTRTFLITRAYVLSSIACQRRHDACLLIADVVEPLNKFQLFLWPSWTHSASGKTCFAVNIYYEAAVEIRLTPIKPSRDIVHLSVDSQCLWSVIARLRVQVTQHSRLIWGLISANLIYSHNSFAGFRLNTIFAYV
jgi:hypothetical protein